MEIALTSSASTSRLRNVFDSVSRFTILGRGPSAMDERARSLSQKFVLITGPTYATRDVFSGEPCGVLVSTPPTCVAEIAARYYALPESARPVLMYTYLPCVAPINFSEFGIDPIPIGPLLQEAGLGSFDHEPYPTSGVFLMLLAAALKKGADVAGIDLYRHASGRTYVTDVTSGQFLWPAHHRLECDLACIRETIHKNPSGFDLSPELLQAINESEGSSFPKEHPAPAKSPKRL